jgi:hypothetical protein
MKQLVTPLSVSYYRLRDPDETERTTARLAAVFENLHANIERLNDEKLAQPARRHTVAIHWVETGELMLKIEIINCAAHRSSFAKGSSATQRTSFPSAAASSHARACIRRNRPCD